MESCPLGRRAGLPGRRVTVAASTQAAIKTTAPRAPARDTLSQGTETPANLLWAPSKFCILVRSKKMAHLLPCSASPEAGPGPGVRGDGRVGKLGRAGLAGPPREVAPHPGFLTRKREKDRVSAPPTGLPHGAREGAR